ncbi:hypothetical protein [Georgenia faecalis]|uniref:Uncharacterized protein n=1 Tax=Georgenia faecalis TaxID=2483799 RepID=A0ABV9DC14_9MICO|nr:hypothetical protein [Georgenia faecalis]
MAGRNPEEDAVARLRAADPGAGAQPDADRLARRTAALRHGDADGPGAVPEGVDELAPRRRRRQPWAAVAAVAASALVVGGVGFGLGRTTTPAIEADGTTSEGMRGGAAEVPAIAAQEDGGARTEALSGTADIAIAPGYGGRTVFTARGLPDAPGSAPAWAFDATQGFDAETVARVAGVLGLEGEPVSEDGMWRVGPVDGSAASVTLSADGTLTVGFSDPAGYPPVEADAATSAAAEPQARSEAGDAGEAEPAAPDHSSTVTPAGPGIAPVPESMPVEPVDPGPVDPAAAEDAVGTLRAVLTELGLDDGAVEYETQESWAGPAVVSVVARQVLGGSRTGLTWNADVTDGGTVLGFYGPAAPTVALGEYDVVSPAQAVERLTDPRFGAASSGIGIMAEPAPMPGWTWGDPPEAPPAPGAVVPWRVTTVTITGAELGVVHHTTEGGASLLLPAYTLTSDDGGQWTVLALADHELAF